MPASAWHLKKAVPTRQKGRWAVAAAHKAFFRAPFFHTVTPFARLFTACARTRDDAVISRRERALLFSNGDGCVEGHAKIAAVLAPFSSQAVEAARLPTALWVTGVSHGHIWYQNSPFSHTRSPSVSHAAVLMARIESAHHFSHPAVNQLPPHGSEEYRSILISRSVFFT